MMTSTGAHLRLSYPASTVTNYSIKEDIGIADIIQLLRDMSVAEKSLFSQVIRVARILLGSSY